MFIPHFHIPYQVGCGIPIQCKATSSNLIRRVTNDDNDLGTHDDYGDGAVGQITAEGHPSKSVGAGDNYGGGSPPAWGVMFIFLFVFKGNH